MIYEPGIIGPTSRVLETIYESWYNGVEFKGTKRMSHGYMFSAFYTLSKAEDTLLDQGAGLTAGVANPFDLTVMKGRSQFDRRHVVGLSWMWEQNHQFENGVTNAILSGWTVSGVTNVSSGNPLNFTMGTDVALDGTGGAGRQLAQLAAGKTVDDIARDHSSREDFVNGVLRYERVRAGHVAAAGDLRQRTEERHQWTGPGKDGLRRGEDVRDSGKQCHAVPVPGRAVQRVQSGQLHHGRRPTPAQRQLRADYRVGRGTNRPGRVQAALVA